MKRHEQIQHQAVLRCNNDPLFHARVHLVSRLLVAEGHAHLADSIAVVLAASDRVMSTAPEDYLSGSLSGNQALHETLLRVAVQSAEPIILPADLPPEDVK